jgi:N-acetylglucosaminyldiphosphoundecaprenol N-acetyl-beta-D-mannosaminyltransferase
MKTNETIAVPRFDVLGVGISALNMGSAVQSLVKAVATPGFVGYVTVTGVHGVMESQDDPDLKVIHNQSFLSTPDGMPLVWLGRKAGHINMTRVYGPDLMIETLRCGIARQWSHLLFGGNAGVAELARQRLTAELPGLRMQCAPTPPFRPLTADEEDDLLHLILRQRPHCLWVGLSTPKQERFMARFIEKHRMRLQSPDHGLVMLGVGAAFDFHAGRVRQAPRFVQKAGCEWLFRLAMEPRRLWKRYLKNNPRFIWRILLSLMKQH